MFLTRRIFLKGLFNTTALVAVPALSVLDGSNTRVYRIWADGKLIEDKFEVIDKGKYAMAVFKDIPLELFRNQIPNVTAEIMIGPGPGIAQGRGFIIQCDPITEKMTELDMGPGKHRNNYEYFASWKVAFGRVI